MKLLYISLLSLTFLLPCTHSWAQQPQTNTTQPSSNDDTANEDDPQPAEGNDDVTPTEGMTRDVEQQLNGWYAKQFMRIDSSRLNAGAAPVYPKEVYMERLRRLPNVIELPYNDIVQEYIDQYTGRLRRSVSLMLGLQNFYMPIFEEALEAEGLPLELKYLPIIESALDPKATSHAGAAGLWQFMTPTAKRYGLTVNSLLDERRDPIKATWAAARYLKDLYQRYNDWTLAIAAYNCGPNNVNKAITRAAGSRDYWQIYPYLPRETRGYVPAFIAANYALNYYCEHNIPPMVATGVPETDTVVVTRDLHLAQVAAVLDLRQDLLEAMNPQYRTGLLPGSSQPCALRLPTASIEKFIQLGDAPYQYAADNFLTRRYSVTPSERSSADETYSERSYSSRKHRSGIHSKKSKREQQREARAKKKHSKKSNTKKSKKSSAKTSKKSGSKKKKKH